ncbi:acyl-CoA dehydrogenase family protein [Streptomyces sp. NPDC058614]|uniref:acyl-CoA dehydrogenase family protein n=1 Tax=Streptomyces sp. NPDC058614 TaxID=3346557 RepID=UPI003649F763
MSQLQPTAPQPGEPNLLDTETETDLRTVVRDLLADRCDPITVVAVYDGDHSITPPLWKALAVELGLAGLLVPEDRGGAGASAREVAVVLEELGRAVAPVPFLTSSVVAATTLLAAPVGGPADELIASLAAGETTAALLLPLATAPGAEASSLTVDADGRISGRVTSVGGAVESDVLLAPVTTPEGTALYAVLARDAVVEPVSSLDMTRRLADVSLDGAAGELLLPPESGAAAVRRGLETGAALLASEQVGVARWCLATTVAYLKDRRQFGRVVGGFQALKHRVADLYVAVESASAAARYAAATVAEDHPDRLVATAVAQAWCSDVAVRTAEEAIQLHAGIGMTWEHPVHLFLKRAKADQIVFGTPGLHRARLGGLVGLVA